MADASRYIPLERLAISPQCGFASTHEGNAISPAVQRQKLELVDRDGPRTCGTARTRSRVAPGELHQGQNNDEGRMTIDD